MKSSIALLISAAIYIGCLFVLPSWTRVAYVDEPPVATRLPPEAGSWKGRRIVYCTNPRHGQIFFEDEHAEGTACPQCGAPLSRWSHIESVLLPPDTRIDRMEYRNAPDGTALTVAIVFSGKDRSSIHRPEVCLVGDGSEVVASETRRIAIDGQRELAVTLLQLRTRRVVNGEVRTGRYFFAYWFMGRNRVTPSHLVRMFWMGYDRVLLGRTYPWAYISVAGTLSQEDDPSAFRKLDDLVKNLYPHLLLSTPTASL